MSVTPEIECYFQACQDVKAHHNYVLEQIHSLQNHLLNTFSKQEGAPSLSSYDDTQVVIKTQVIISHRLGLLIHMKFLQSILFYAS